MPSPAIRRQMAIHPTAATPAERPTGSHIAVTTSAAAKGCSRWATFEIALVPPIARLNSNPSGTITRGANRKSSLISPNRAMPMRARTAITTQARAPPVAQLRAQRPLARFVDFSAFSTVEGDSSFSFSVGRSSIVAMVDPPISSLARFLLRKAADLISTKPSRRSPPSTSGMQDRARQGCDSRAAPRGRNRRPATQF